MRHTYLLLPMALAAVSCNTAPDYDATGIFEATTVTIASETTGKILTFNMSEGDSIVVGEPIAVIDTTLLVLQQKQVMSQQQSAESSSPDIAAQAGCQVVGVGAVIEKAYQGGAERLREKGFRVESLSRIKSIDDGNVIFG